MYVNTEEINSNSFHSINIYYLFNCEVHVHENYD